MIQLLKSLLGAKADDSCGKPAASGNARRPAAKVCDFRAVSLAPSLECCTATKAVASKRLLWREAPNLPLSGCTMRSDCSCKFRKHADRRDGERRLLGGQADKQWFVNSERRKRQGRRAA
jgi:hypothetical protein